MAVRAKFPIMPSGRVETAGLPEGMKTIGEVVGAIQKAAQLKAADPVRDFAAGEDFEAGNDTDSRLAALEAMARRVPALEAQVARLTKRINEEE